MDYVKIYNNLMGRARDRVLDTYTETHHIIPRCMGGSDDMDNLVNLTYREHFIAHWLLYRIHPTNSKIAFAFTAMTMDKYGNKLVEGQWTPSSRQLEELKIARIKARRGRPHTAETRKKISESNKGKKRTTQRTLSDITKERMSQSAYNRWSNPSDNVISGIERMKMKKTGVKRNPMSDDVKARISEGVKSSHSRATEPLYNKVIELYTDGVPLLQIQKITSISRPTINKILSKHKCKRM
jgi:hypothetical protein